MAETEPIRFSRWKFPRQHQIRALLESVPSPSQESILRSLRFRLTAWYAGVLIVTLILVSVSITAIVGRGLQNSTDSQLLQIATQLAAETNEAFSSTTAGTTGDLSEVVRTWPDVSNILLSGYWIQYVNADGTLQEVEETDVASNIVFPLDLLNQVPYNAVIETRELTYTSVENDQLRARTVVVPLEFQSGTGETLGIFGAIIVGTSVETRNETLDVVQRITWLSCFIGVLVAIGAGWMVAGYALGPVKRIARAAEEVAAQPSSPESLAIRIDVPRSHDEVSNLARTFNTMLQRIEGAFNVQRRFVADASHELRTPLTALRGNVDVLLRQAKSGRDLDAEILVESLNDMSRESSRMARLVDDLLTLARDDVHSGDDELSTNLLSLDDLARDAIVTLEPLGEEVRLELQADEEVQIFGDPDRLTQVMIILGENAIRHTPPGGTVTISIVPPDASVEDVPCARIEVHDTGSGIAEEHLPHIFERFYRASGSRARHSGGSGLGLAIALGIVRAHGGWIDVETAPGKGSLFSVCLPIEGPE